MKQILNTSKAPAPIGPYNQSILINDTLYVSGQIAIDQSTGELVNETIEMETHRVLQNIELILQNAEMNFENVVKTSVFLTDMGNYSKVNGVYAEYFRESTAPARELVEVTALPKYVNVEISVIAVKA